MKRFIPILLIATITPVAVLSAATEPNNATLLANLKWRSIGPANMGGRVTAIEGVAGDPFTFYVGGADGGIFKTTNGGTTFKPIFDNQDVLSIGAITVAPSDPNVIWVGTGEGDPRNTASFGDGVYRSTDAGDTWKHLGLNETERIKRIKVDPRDPDTAYVAALGRAWGPNEERGVFKTTDGGKTWAKTLFIDKDTGCSDIDIDPQNPRILYAGMYSFRRKPWRFDSGGGQTALYKSIDSGTSWKKLVNGLPRTPMDRIGVAIARSNPLTVYMITETKTEGNLFRSDDRGETWRMVHNDPNINFRPFYYSDIRVDPNDPERIYSLGGGLSVSRDGGRTFARIANGVHGDHQAMWIDPMNSNRVLNGSDGGFQVSNDKGATFEVINNVVLSQYYHITYDMRQPYYVYGGLQDNGNWVGPSATLFREGIRKDDWYTVSGGDGFFVVPDPSSPNIVYSDSQGGTISLTDTNSGNTRSIHPYPKETGSSGNAIAGYKYRFNWNPPIAASPHDPKTVYYGGNVLFKTTNYGHSWQEISPDLTTNDKSKQQSSGGPVVVDNTAAEFHCTILAIAESPVKPGVIWVGTDDGNVQVTQDGGKTWKNVVVNIKGLPPNSWVPNIDASHFDAGTAYVAFDRHQDDDFGPWAFKTTDFGQTWTSVKGDLPSKGYVHIVREDPKVKTLLYCGTELGVFASWDGGNHWVSIRNNIPPVAVRDIVVHPRDNDLIIATHGRGVFILDSAAALQELATAKTNDVFLFDVRPTTRYQMWGKDSNLGQKTFAAQNPPAGALVDYYLKADVSGPIVITVADKSGKTIRTIRSNANKAGVNRVVWDLRYDPPTPAPGAGPGDGVARGAAASPGGRAQGPGGFGGRLRGDVGLAPGREGPRAAEPTGAAPAEQAGTGAVGPPAAEGFGGGRFGFGGGPAVVPGEYTITLRAGGKQLSKTVRVGLDPRVKISDADLAAQLDAALKLRDLSSTLNSVVARIDDLTRQLTTLSETMRKVPEPAATAGRQVGGAGDGDGSGGTAARTSTQSDNLSADFATALDELKKLRATLVREASFSYRYPPKLREEVNSLMGSINAAIAPPTEPQMLRLREVTEETQKAVSDLNALISGSIRRINEKLSSQPHVITGPAVR
ncbi:MAG TPA: hypothetical protein VLM38_04675 [Blastocatellia bacterium]|nr:hypothetical protein [Blastocatellia bacterium]